MIITKFCLSPVALLIPNTAMCQSNNTSAARGWENKNASTEKRDHASITSILVTLLRNSILSLSPHILHPSPLQPLLSQSIIGHSLSSRPLGPLLPNLALPDQRAHILRHVDGLSLLLDPCIALDTLSPFSSGDALLSVNPVHHQFAKLCGGVDPALYNNEVKFRVEDADPR